jgi:anthranilate synthase component 1
MDAAPASAFAEFREHYDAGRGRVLWLRGVADLETPVAAYLKLAHGRPNTFLLESVEGGQRAGATPSSGWSRI